MQTITEEAKKYLDNKYMNAMPDAIYRRQVEKAVLDPKFIKALGLSSNEWISVEDNGNPKGNGSYLIFNDYGGMMVWRYEDKWLPYGFGQTITHYMHLPSPPTDKQP